ncbi:MAG: tripartite tricarboxylate transporter substrate binding protein [Burkholderiaceae bacterium]|nr:tripartite tricarboxylate transporter substrate binding protein [Burkholderiaceae bacterium]
MRTMPLALCRAFPLFALLGFSGLLGVAPASAQEYPFKTVDVIVPSAVGNVADVIGRAVLTEMQAKLSTAFVPTNVAAAGGAVGMQQFARRKPDGSTLALISGSIPPLPFLIKDFTLDPVKDLAPICLFGIGQYVMFVHPDLPVRSLKEFIAYVRANPGKVNVGHQGGQNELAINMLIKQGNLAITPIAYRGVPQVINATLAGELQMMFTSPLPMKQFVETGKLRPIAVFSDTPIPPELVTKGFENLPLMRSEVPEFRGPAPWFGLVGHAAMPRNLVTQLGDSCDAAVRTDAISSTIRRLGYASVKPGPAAIGDLIREDMVTLRQQAELLKK